MRRDDCVFCKIINGEFPSRTLYETDKFKVILDIAPVTKGHALIMPKEHFENLYELPDEVAAEAMILAKSIAIELKDRLHADGMNIIQNNGEVADQTVPHYHLHVIPRYEHEVGIFNWGHKSPSVEELDAIQQEILGADSTSITL